MKVPQFAERWIVKLLLKKAGPEVQKAVTAAAAAALTWAATNIPGIEGIISPETMILLLWVLIDVGVTKLAAGPLKQYSKELQEFLNRNGAKLEVDEFIGPVTIQAAKDLKDKEDLELTQRSVG